MPAFDEHKDELEYYETMMGPQRGRLAVSLDLLTNALVLVGQHGVYCHSNRDRRRAGDGHPHHPSGNRQGEGTDSKRDGSNAHGTREESLTVTFPPPDSSIE